MDPDALHQSGLIACGPCILRTVAALLRCCHRHSGMTLPFPPLQMRHRHLALITCGYPRFPLLETKNMREPISFGSRSVSVRMITRCWSSWPHSCTR